MYAFEVTHADENAIEIKGAALGSDVMIHSLTIYANGPEHAKLIAAQILNWICQPKGASNNVLSLSNLDAFPA